MENTEAPVAANTTTTGTTEAQAPAPTPTEAQVQATPKASRNPFKKVLSYLQGEADKSAKNRWEGSSYLSSNGMEPQQRLRKKSKGKNSTRSASEVSNTQTA